MLFSKSSSGEGTPAVPGGGAVARISKPFGSVACTTRSTNIPGTWIEFGDNEPIGTISSAYTVISPSVKEFSCYPHLYDNQPRIPCHGIIVVVRDISEDEVSCLVCPPGVDERDVASDGRLHDIPLSLEFSEFLFVAGDQDTVFEAAWIKSDGYATGLNGRRGTRGREEGRDACTVRTHPFNKGTLRDQFEGHLPIKVHLLKIFVSEQQ